MHCVDGRVSMFLYDHNGILNGLLLGRGQEVRFWVTHANVEAVKKIARMSSQVEVQGDLRTDGRGQEYLHASLITNLDSKRTASLPAPVCQGKPGMLSDGAPNTMASLAHHLDTSIADEEEKRATPQARTGCTALEPALAEDGSKALHPGSYFHGLLQQNDGNSAALARDGAARSIAFAYDSLHRIQAILAYLHIIKHRVPGISQFLDEAKRTYEQALARFGTADFTSAKEFAEASGSLSRVVEIVMARTLRSDTSLPSLVPPPPDHGGGSPEPKQVEEHLAQAETVLSRIHWVLENGTLPSEERAQVRKIASWGDAFYKQAQHTYRDAVLDDAAELAQAALAGAHSAEHVCRKWYVSHPARP
jgi:hypothetical protein